MKNKSATKANIFILELTIIILIFALTSAISISLFAKAHQVGQKASETNYAMMKIQSLAETMKSKENLLELKELLANEQTTLYFDEEWASITDRAKASYVIETSGSSEKTVAGTLATVKYLARKNLTDSTLLYQLQVQKYFPQQGGKSK
ncbi:MAG: hypothetical protein WCI30_06920 [Clostridia bacterium]